MKILSMFRASARELKSPLCLSVTGLLIAMYVILNMFVRIEPFEGVKITFNYLPLSVIGMLYGPVVSTVAAVACDIIAPLFEGRALSYWLIPSRMAEGFIYGFFLYNIKIEKNKVFLAVSSFKIIAARVLAMALCYQIYNTNVLFYIYGMSEDTFNAYFLARLIKNLIQFPMDIILMFMLLPAINIAYRKALQGFGEERRNL
ncbi:MAG: folate family ECF transporter S component [Oscillospiraceae bacterium]|nr:folate family ECF transporter S component [Oscillospiraceae bacterium]